MENSESSLKFTQTENKIRKKWLFVSTILPSAVLGYAIIFIIFNAVISSNYIVILQSLFPSLVLAGGIYMNYYCAFKNPGTLLLLIMMFLISIYLPLIFLPKNLTLMKVSLNFTLFNLWIIIYNIIVFYYSFKLRKINKKMKEIRLINSPIYIKALSVFSTATNFDELNAQLERLQSSHDSESEIEALAKAYDNQKGILTLAKSRLND